MQCSSSYVITAYNHLNIMCMHACTRVFLPPVMPGNEAKGSSTQLGPAINALTQCSWFQIHIHPLDCNWDIQILCCFINSRDHSSVSVHCKCEPLLPLLGMQKLHVLLVSDLYALHSCWNSNIVSCWALRVSHTPLNLNSSGTRSGWSGNSNLDGNETAN